MLSCCFHAEYQVDMMKNLRIVNVDHNAVGWYQSALLESFINQSMIESQYSYQKEIPNSVVVVYDPFSTTKGTSSICLFTKNYFAFTTSVHLLLILEN